MDKDAQTVARYSYDAWGVPTIKEDTSGCNIATVNPFRYRGYFYDAETKQYYLQSRYYDPEVGRFVNSDRILYQTSWLIQNAFSYCDNSPINKIDCFGNFPLTMTGAIGLGILASPWFWVGLLGVIVVSLIVYLAYNANSISMPATYTKELSDVKVKKQNKNSKLYQLAYINAQGSLIRHYPKMTFTEALSTLGVTGATNSITQRFTYARDRSSMAQRQLEKKRDR